MKFGRLLTGAKAVVAPLVFAAPANATHVLCGQVITTNTTLDSDVVCPPGVSPGLRMNANNITLNLRNYRVIGQAGELSVGIDKGQAPPGTDGPAFATGIAVRDPMP
jgi:hypothetical protein